MWPLLVMLSFGKPVWLSLIGYLHTMHNYSSLAVHNYGGDTGCPVTMSILQNFIPEVIPSQKCDMNMGQILELHSYGCVLLQFCCTCEQEWTCSSRSMPTSSALGSTQCNQTVTSLLNVGVNIPFTWTLYTVFTRESHWKSSIVRTYITYLMSYKPVFPLCISFIVW
jgi:hypothetical protein